MGEKLPDGVGLKVVLFLTSDSIDADVMVEMGVFHKLLDKFHDPDVPKLIDELKLGDLAPDWRLMTDAEVNAYLERKRAEERETE